MKSTQTTNSQSLKARSLHGCTRPLAVALLFIVSLLGASEAQAEVPDISVGIRSGGIIIGDRGLDPLSSVDTNYQGGAVVDVEIFRDMLFVGERISLGLEYSSMSHNESLYDSFDTSVVSEHALFTATYGVEVLPWLTPYVRTAAGASYHTLDIDDKIHDEVDGLFSGYSGLGVELKAPPEFWPTTTRRTLGIRLEMGHTYRAEPEFHAKRELNTPEDASKMELNAVSLGSMPVNGPYFALEFFGRF